MKVKRTYEGYKNLGKGSFEKKKSSEFSEPWSGPPPLKIQKDQKLFSVAIAT